MFSKAVRGVLAVLGALGILAYFNSRKKQAAPGAAPEPAAGPQTPPAGEELTEEQAAEVVSTWNVLNPP